MIKELLPDGRNVVDDNGDVMPRHDYARSEYPELPGQILSAKDILGSIDNYEDSLHFAELAKRGTHDRDVRLAGGVKECRRHGLELMLRSRHIYLRSQGVEVIHSPEITDPDYEKKQDEFDRGVALWMTFRASVLASEDQRIAKRDELEQKIEQYERLLHL